MTPEFATAFAVMQAELPTVPKSRKGQEGKQTYKYADLASIMEAASPALVKHGFALMHKPIVSTRADGLTEAGVHAMLIHSSGHFEECSFVMPVTKEYGTMAKTIGGIITYARRYSLSILGICTEDDSDNAQGVGSKPYVDESIAKPNRQPEPRAPKKTPAMSAANREKLKFAARERMKELTGDSGTADDIMGVLTDAAKSLGVASPIQMTDDHYPPALEAVQKWEPAA